jgi:multidrug transporter EmrE-like cation transporter
VLGVAVVGIPPQGERSSPVRLALLTLIVTGVIGLKVAES